MSNLVIGLIGLFAGLGLVALRVPIGIALGSVSFVGIAVLLNWTAAWGMFSAMPFNFVGNWELTAVPMFLLMGFLCSNAGLTKGLFEGMRILLDKIPGGLAISSVFACALFATASGSSVATSSAMARIATPEMLRHKYDPGLASGVVAASGTLGSLIPPSVLMILFAVYAEVSVGKLFAAGFIPGALSALVYSGMIYLRVKLKPSLAPAASSPYTRREKIEVLSNIWPLPVLITAVMGGIFTGVFSPTEAGGVGAFAAALIALLRGHLSFKVIVNATTQAAKGTASIFIILIGTLLLSRFLALSGVPSAFSSAILSVSDNPLYVILAVAIIYLVLGMFVDSIGLMLLTLPLILPVAIEADINLIWFGIILIKLLEIGLVTPPVGLNVYVIKSAIGNAIPLGTIFRGVGWFMIMDLITLIILVAFPALSLWLPSLMGV